MRKNLKRTNRIKGSFCEELQTFDVGRISCAVSGGGIGFRVRQSTADVYAFSGLDTAFATVGVIFADCIAGRLGGRAVVGAGWSIAWQRWKGAVKFGFRGLVAHRRCEKVLR